MYRKYEKLYRNTLNRASFENLGSTPFSKLIISIPPQENCQLDSKLKSVKIKRAVGDGDSRNLFMFKLQGKS